MECFFFFRRAEANKNPCSTCVTGCELKELMEKKRNECKSQKKKFKEKVLRIVGYYKKNTTFATAIEKDLVPWMSGLVSGLQNRVRRFESARNLIKLL